MGLMDSIKGLFSKNKNTVKSGIDTAAKAVADKTPDQIDGAVKQAADMAKDTVDKVADEAEKTD